MQAVVLDRQGQPALRDVPRPQPRPAELLVRVRAVGLCGSDVEKLSPANAGAVLGHEIAGVVEAGPLPTGTRVVVSHRVPCDTCATCLAGHETTCPQFLASGLRPGGFAEAVVAPPAHVAAVVLPLPEAMTDIEATFVEPLACVLRGIAGLPHGAGAVVGCGAVGRLALRALTARGDRVHVADTDARRLIDALAEASGPAHAGDALDYAVVTAAAGLNDALQMLRPGGTLLIFAAQGDRTSIDLDTIYRNELVLQGSRSATPLALRQALQAITTGTIRVADLATDVLPLDRFIEGLERYRDRKALKVVFTP